MDAKEEKIIIAIFYAIVTALMFSVMSVFVRLSVDQAPTSVILLMRFFVSFLLILPFMMVGYRRRTFTFKNHRWGMQIFRGVCGLTSIGLYVLSIHYIPLVDALLLESTCPLFMPLIVWAAMGVRSRWPLWIAILIGFIGVVFVLKPGHVSFQWADLLALGSGFFAAVSILSIRQLSKTEARMNIMASYFIISIIISGIIALFQWRVMSAETWIYLILVGVTATIYQYALTAALGHASARIVSPLLYLALIFTGLIEWYFWNYVPDVYTLVGMVIIVGSGLAVVLLRDREKIIT